MQPQEYFVKEFILKKEESTTNQDDDFFEFLDADGNPFKPEEPVSYKLIGEDGSVLKEGTISDNNKIPLKDIKTRKFSVVLDSFTISDPDGFELINLESDNTPSDIKSENGYSESESNE